MPEIPSFLVTALLLGLSAGLFEELTRYGMYRWWAKDARTWGKSVLLGTGWGGVEAIFVGLIILYAYIQVLYLGSADLSTLLPPEQIELARSQIEAYWSIPWYMSMLGFVERMLAIPIQIALSVMMLQVFIRKQSRWLWIAILWHTLVDTLAVFLLQYWKGYDWASFAIEGVIAILSIISLAILFGLKQPEPEPDPEPEPALQQLMDVSTLAEPEVTSDDLDDSQYL